MRGQEVASSLFFGWFRGEEAASFFFALQVFDIKVVIVERKIERERERERR